MLIARKRAGTTSHRRVPARLSSLGHWDMLTAGRQQRLGNETHPSPCPSKQRPPHNHACRESTDTALTTTTTPSSGPSTGCWLPPNCLCLCPLHKTSLMRCLTAELSVLGQHPCQGRVPPPLTLPEAAQHSCCPCLQTGTHTWAGSSCHCIISTSAGQVASMQAGVASHCPRDDMAAKGYTNSFWK